MIHLDHRILCNERKKNDAIDFFSQLTEKRRGSAAFEDL
jgi:hypothetical protein